MLTQFSVASPNAGNGDRQRSEAWPMRRMFLPTAMAVAALATMTACGGGSGSGSSTTTQKSASSTTARSGTSVPLNRGAKPAVDLTFTGTVALTAKGSAGQCQ